ncbi:DUF3955 domain-containing protein [Holdemanella porci]|uniref:DUF3955 domain-containing protein n=1 Tax=Holdemanella porci TaxID=2652276 RepID=UPI003F921B08
MDQKDRVFTPAFVANLFLIAGTVFLLLKEKINAYVGVDGLKHEGMALALIGFSFMVVGMCIWIVIWISRRMNK